VHVRQLPVYENKSIKEGALTENSAGIGNVTRKIVRERAVELAIISGHSKADVSKSD